MRVAGNCTRPCAVRYRVDEQIRGPERWWRNGNAIIVNAIVWQHGKEQLNHCRDSVICRKSVALFSWLNWMSVIERFDRNWFLTAYLFQDERGEGSWEHILPKLIFNNLSFQRWGKGACESLYFYVWRAVKNLIRILVTVYKKCLWTVSRSKNNHLNPP